MIRGKIKFNYKNQLFNEEEYVEGETIEEKVRRVVEEKEPIDDGAPIIYTDESRGVMAQYNIRTDRWEIAQEMMDTAYKAEIAKAKNFGQKQDEEQGQGTEDKGGQGTEDKGGSGKEPGGSQGGIEGI